jgi:hypothetical protein
MPLMVARDLGADVQEALKSESANPKAMSVAA